MFFFASGCLGEVCGEEFSGVALGGVGFLSAGCLIVIALPHTFITGTTAPVHEDEVVDCLLCRLVDRGLFGLSMAIKFYSLEKDT